MGTNNIYASYHPRTRDTLCDTLSRYSILVHREAPRNISENGHCARRVRFVNVRWHLAHSRIHTRSTSTAPGCSLSLTERIKYSLYGKRSVLSLVHNYDLWSAVFVPARARMSSRSSSSGYVLHTTNRFARFPGVNWHCGCVVFSRLGSLGSRVAGNYSGLWLTIRLALLFRI